MSHSSNVRNDGLTPSQERAVSALLAARSIAAAARQAKVGESSIRRWLHQDENFQQKLRRRRDESLSHAAFQLQQGASEAAAVIRDVVKGDTAVTSPRASIIRVAAEFGFRSRVYDDVAERLKAVEAKQLEAAK